MMRTVRAIPFLLVFCLIFPAANLFGQAKAPAKKSATGKGTPSKAAGGGADPALLNPALMKARAPDTFKVHVNSTAGPFTVEVTRAWSPLGADRFYNLCKHHFFDGAAFFRVVPGFVVQFGLSAIPKVSQIWQDAKLKDDPVTQSNHRGTLTFATAGPNTRTTQLFINLGDNTGLDRQGFSPFGSVSEGMDVVDKIYSVDREKPDQGLITAQGKAYLDAKFPKLDKITATTIEAPPPAAAPTKSDAKAPAKAPAKSAPPKQPS
jgi:peptidyl-prolyl cis-trans isomerase A (cyclophilin A)